MNQKDKAEFTTLISDALNDVMIPALESMEERLKNELASKEDLEKVNKDLGMQISSLDRKFDAQQTRLDRHDVRITKLEEKATFVTS